MKIIEKSMKNYEKPMKNYEKLMNKYENHWKNYGRFRSSWWPGPNFLQILLNFFKN